jgi:hypothetical protein
VYKQAAHEQIERENLIRLLRRIAARCPILRLNIIPHVIEYKNNAQNLVPINFREYKTQHL